MKKLLLQIDSSRLPSVFDAVVAYDAGADELMSRGGVTEKEVRDLVHGCIFTRGPKDLKNTAIFIGGTDMSEGEKLLAAAEKSVFDGFRVSMMLDSNGSNTTAVAAVEKIMRTVGDVKGKKVLVTAGTGPVGMRAAGLFSKAGANVTITSRKTEEGDRIRKAISDRFGGEIHAAVMHDSSEAGRIIDEVKPQILLNAGPAGILLVPRDAWTGKTGLLVACDLNAVPPLGIEGIEVTDNGEKRDGTTTFGALGIGGFKIKLHKRCIARLFESNDAVLDAETIAEVAGEIE
jgi:hypothetical protein